MAATPYRVADSFSAKKTARSGSFVSVGDALYSYGLKLVHHEGDRIVWDICPVNPPKISVTTSRHINAAVAELPTHGHVCTDCEATS